jgi:hypothetical protein
MEKLVAPLRSPEGGPVRRSSLPPPELLAMHVDAGTFTDILGRDTAFKQSSVVDELASAIHEAFLQLSKDPEKGFPVQPRFDRPFKDLEAVNQEDNRAAARRIPDVIALAGLELEKADSPAPPDAVADETTIKEHLEHHLERLAEAEHDGWMDHRLKNGWRYGEKREDTLKLHPAMRPWAELSEKDKDKDRNSVRQYPANAKLAGYRIVFAGNDPSSRQRRPVG